MVCKFMQDKKIKMIVGTLIYLLISLGIAGLLYMNRSGKEYRLFNHPDVIEQENDLETASLTLPKGDYYLVVNYASASDVSLTVYIDREHQMEEMLPKNEEGYYAINFSVNQSTSLFHIIVNEGVTKDFKVYNYEITGSKELNRDDTYFAILFFTISAIFYVLYITGFLRRLTDKQKIAAASLIGLVIFTSYPMFTNYLVYGHDLQAHLLRIEGVKDALREGHFLAEIYPENNNGYGLLGFIYPNLFLRIPALLRLCDVSMVTAYHTLIVLINVATAISMYCSVKSITKSKFSAIFGTVLYMLAPYRLCDLYIRSAIGEALAMIFLPLAIAGIYHILLGEKSKWYYLLIGLTGITQSHVLSCLLIGLVMIFLCVIFVKYLLLERRYLKLIMTLGTFVLLNIWYIIPFMVYYSTPLEMVKIENTDFYEESVFGAQLFMTNAFCNLSTKAEAGIGEEMSMSIGMIGWTALLIIMIYLICHKEREKVKYRQFVLSLFCISIFMLFLSSSACPWFKLSHYAFISDLLGIIQFTFRFLCIASVCLSLACPMVIEQSEYLNIYRKPLLMLFIILGMIGSYELMDRYTVQEVKFNEFSGGFSDTTIIEYLPEGTDMEIFHNTDVWTDGVEIGEYTKQGTSIKFSYSNAQEGAFVTLPLLYYPGYDVKLEDGTKLKSDMGEKNRLRVYIPNGINAGTIYVRYSYWSIMSII